MAESITLVELGRQLQALGYECSEHPAFGGVTAGAHARNSWHYRASGNGVGAIDVNVAPPGDHPREREMLETLWTSLVRGKDSLEQVIYRGRGYFGGQRGSRWGGYGHQTHLHVAASGPITGVDDIVSAGASASGMLKLGASGPDVGKWQQRLLRHDAQALPNARVDHDFGPRTEKATTSLQRHLDIKVDGIVGPATRKALRAHLATGGHPHNEPVDATAERDRRAAVRRATKALPTVRRQEDGLFIITAQGALLTLGYEPGPVDGVFGTVTQQALERFQAERDLTVDGVAGPMTWRALEKCTRDPERFRAGTRGRAPAGPDAGDQTLSDAGVSFIGRFEGFRGELYNDPAGHCTIGFGHLVHHGPIDGSEPDEFKQGISRERALEILRSDAARAASAVREQVSVALDQAQFDALTSFTFNLGAGNLSESTLLRRLNEGDYGAVPSELRRWNKAGGRVLAGLTRRRAAEGRLFSTGVYDED